MIIEGSEVVKMSRIERNDTQTSNSGKKIKSFWQNGKKEPFFWLTLYTPICLSMMFIYRPLSGSVNSIIDSFNICKF